MSDSPSWNVSVLMVWVIQIPTTSPSYVVPKATKQLMSSLYMGATDAVNTRRTTHDRHYHPRPRSLLNMTNTMNQLPMIYSLTLTILGRLKDAHPDSEFKIIGQPELHYIREVRPTKKGDLVVMHGKPVHAHAPNKPDTMKRSHKTPHRIWKEPKKAPQVLTRRAS
jgi:hypothetical protein